MASSAPSIVNPTPITPGPCGQYWPVSLNVAADRFSARLVPTDGTNLLGNAAALHCVSQPASDAATGAIIAALFAGCLAAVGQPGVVTRVMTGGSEPGKPMTASVIIAKKIHLVRDLTALPVWPQVVAYLQGK